MLTSVINSYYINELNEEQIFFSYSIINYGYEEAKNVEVVCILYDENDDVVLREKENIGNVASTSIVYKEMYADYYVEDDELLGPGCMIVGCDNCEILTNRILEYRELLEKYTIE